MNALVVALLLLIPVALSQDQQTCNCTSAPLRVATYNTAQYFFMPFTSQRFNAMIQYFQMPTTNIDILCLQEIADPVQRQTLVNQLKTQFPYAFSAPQFQQNCSAGCTGTEILNFESCLNSSGCLGAGVDTVACIQEHCLSAFSSLSDSCKICLSPSANNMQQKLQRCAPRSVLNTTEPGAPVASGCYYLFDAQPDTLLLSKYPFQKTDFLAYLQSPFQVWTALYGLIETPQLGPVHTFCTHIVADVPVLDLEAANLNQTQELLMWVDSKVSGNMTQQPTTPVTPTSPTASPTVTTVISPTIPTATVVVPTSINPTSPLPSLPSGFTSPPSSKRRRQVGLQPKYNDTNQPVIIMGDFNSGPAIDGITATFPQSYNQFIRKGYLNLYIVNAKRMQTPGQPFSINCTYCSQNPLSGLINLTFGVVHLESDKDYIIDHIFLGGSERKILSNVCLLNSSIFLSDNIVNVNGRMFPASDHYGVVASLCCAPGYSGLVNATAGPTSTVTFTQPTIAPTVERPIIPTAAGVSLSPLGVLSVVIMLFSLIVKW